MHKTDFNSFHLYIILTGNTSKGDYLFSNWITPGGKILLRVGRNSSLSKITPHTKEILKGFVKSQIISKFMLELKIQRKADCVVTFNELQCTSFITKTGLFKYSTAQVKEPKNSLFRISAFRELAKNTRNQTE